MFRRQSNSGTRKRLVKPNVLNFGFLAVIIDLILLFNAQFLFPDNYEIMRIFLLAYFVMWCLCFAIDRTRSILFSMNVSDFLIPAVISFAVTFGIVYFMKSSSGDPFSIVSITIPLFLYNFFVVGIVEETFRNEFAEKYIGQVPAIALFTGMHYWVYSGNVISLIILFGITFVWSFLWDSFGSGAAVGSHSAWNTALETLKNTGV